MAKLSQDKAIKRMQEIYAAPIQPTLIKERLAQIRAAGVTVALGHTAGNFGNAAAGTNAGATVVTHFMNAMDKGLNEQSFASFVIADERLTVELILDGHHVPFKTAKEIYAAVGDRLIFVSDAMAAAGGTDGDYTIGKLPVIVNNGVARLQTNGSLAGSTLTMDAVFSNSIHELGLSIPEAVAATSTRAAQRMRLSDRGEIAVGKRADLLSYNMDCRSITLIN
jgi:N-acetylglucosamine-6-phosphate deacetylase